MDSRKGIRAIVIYLLTVLLVIVSGCDRPTVQGEAGVLQFHEPNSYPDEKFGISAQGFDHPMVVGGQADLSIPNCTILEASTDDPDVIRVEGADWPVDLIGRNYVRLSALRAGATRLRVTARCNQNFQLVEKSDSLFLTAAVADQITTTLDKSSFSYGLLGSEFALRPNASVSIEAQAFRQGQALLGFNFIAWGFDETLIELSATDTETIPANGRVNRIKLTGRGVTGSTTVTTQHGQGFDIHTLAADAPVTLRVFSLTRLRPPEVITVTPVEIIQFTPLDFNFLLVGQDSAGRHVLPSREDEQGFSFTVLEGSFDQLNVKRKLSKFTITGCGGSGLIRLSYLGADVDIALEIGPDHAHDDCP